MQEYKILIVDDEADVREGIVTHIDWKNIGFEVIGQAENGQDALNQLETNEVDVVLTDIKMPFMDGLTMSAQIMDMYPAAKIIILSGFDEFEYAKEAIKLNVVEYILKPVNVAELTAILSRIKKQLDESIEQKRNIESLRQSYLQSLPLMRERFLNDLLWGSISPEDVATQVNLYQLPFATHPYHIVTIFETENTSKTKPTIEPELVPVSIRQIVWEHLEKHCHSEVFIGSYSIIAITFWDRPIPISTLMKLVDDICTECFRVLELKVTAGIGRCYREAGQVHLSFSEAKAALEYKVVSGSGKAIYIQDMEQIKQEKFPFDNQDEEQLLAAIKFGNGEQTNRLVAAIFSQMEHLVQWEQQATILNLFHLAYRIVQRYGLQNEDSIMAKIQFFLSAPKQWEDKQVMQEWFLEICLDISQKINSRRESASSVIAEEAKQYIANHYKDSDLSVDKICDHLHISQSYFSTVFKQETGTSYIQYLTDIRMNRALELLRQTDGKTYIIANKVGYDDPNYFSYVFKKYYGLSPTKYRKEIEEPLRNQAQNL